MELSVSILGIKDEKEKIEQISSKKVSDKVFLLSSSRCYGWTFCFKHY